MDVNAIPLGARTAKPALEPVPEVEWWDRALLPGEKGQQQYATSMSEDGQEVGLQAELGTSENSCASTMLVCRQGTRCRAFSGCHAAA